MTRRILVVDDDRAMVKTLCDIFRLRGWEPQPAYSGKEAVALQRQEKYPVVLMDIKMADMDGISASKVMRTEDPELKIFLMTAHTGPYSVREVARDGTYHLVPKPIDLNSLLSLLE
ncbi:MAG TPA: response regulator [Gemmatimonadales bacterium]|nr:response regulator [Gemmatimonadales bacterium]